MSRHQITSVRANIKTIAAAIVGLAAARITVGMLDVDVDDDIYEKLNTQVPTQIDVNGTVATATFAAAPVFAVGQLITIDCPGLTALNATYAGAHAVTVVGANTIQWDITTAAPATVVPAASDLVFTTPLITIKPAENPKTDGDTGIPDTTVEILIHFGLAADISQDYLPIESLVYQLRDALVDQSNWANVCCGVQNCRIAAPRLLRKKKPFVGVYTLTLEFMGV